MFRLTRSRRRTLAGGERGGPDRDGRRLRPRWRRTYGPSAGLVFAARLERSGPVVLCEGERDALALALTRTGGTVRAVGGPGGYLRSGRRGAPLSGTPSPPGNPRRSPGARSGRRPAPKTTGTRPSVPLRHGGPLPFAVLFVGPYAVAASGRIMTIALDEKQNNERTLGGLVVARPDSLPITSLADAGRLCPRCAHRQMGRSFRGGSAGSMIARIFRLSCASGSRR